MVTQVLEGRTRMNLENIQTKNEMKLLKEANREQKEQSLKAFDKTRNNMNLESFRFIDISIEATKRTIHDESLVDKNVNADGAIKDFLILKNLRTRKSEKKKCSENLYIFLTITI